MSDGCARCAACTYAPQGRPPGRPRARNGKPWQRSPGDRGRLRLSRTYPEGAPRRSRARLLRVRNVRVRAAMRQRPPGTRRGRGRDPAPIPRLGYGACTVSESSATQCPHRVRVIRPAAGDVQRWGALCGPGPSARPAASRSGALSPLAAAQTRRAVTVGTLPPRSRSPVKFPSRWPPPPPQGLGAVERAMLRRGRAAVVPGGGTWRGT